MKFALIKRLSLFLLFIVCISKANVPHYTANDRYSRTFVKKMFSYLPAHELAERIINHIMHGEKGAYLAYDFEEIIERSDKESHLDNELLRYALHRSPGSIYRAAPLYCKNSADIGSYISDYSSCYTHIIDPIKAYGGLGHIVFSSMYFLSKLFIQDQNRAVRFLKIVEHAGPLICIAQSDSYLANLFKKKAEILSLSAHSREYILGRCKKTFEQTYGVVLLDGRIASHELVPWLSRYNCFICDIDLNQMNVADYEKLCSRMENNIKLLYTSAVFSNEDKLRQQEYEKSLNILRSFWYDPYIVEACAQGDTFFNELSHRVCYTQSNAQTNHKGVNEIRSIKVGLQHYNFDDQDMIVKITGRYFFKNDLFLRMIENNSNVDGFVTIDTLNHFAFTGCFALRGRYFKQFMQEIDLDELDKYSIDIERAIIEYMHNLEKAGVRIKYVEELHVQALVGGWRICHF